MRNYFERTFRFAIVAALIALASCGDDPAPIHEEELTNGTGKWKLTALTVKAAGQSGDAYADMEACDKDNIFYFNSNGTYQYQVGATTCYAGEPMIIEEGTWEIEGKNLIIQIGSDDPEAVQIKLLNATTLKTTLSIDIFGVSAVINSTYTKQ